LDFFIDFYELCQKSQKGIVLVAESNADIIGGIFCPFEYKKTMYEWYVCGLDKEYPSNHPSIMVTWNALLYASQNGIHRFDFMGLGKPEIPYGVRDFKLRFGGDVVNYGRYMYNYS
jgi:serine/alanine adding enzyme